MAYDKDSPDEDNAALSDLVQIKENFNQLRIFEAGASAPSPTVAYMRWLYIPASGNWVMRQRNAANDAWLNLFEIDPTTGELELSNNLNFNEKSLVFAVPGTDLMAIGSIETVTVDANATGFGAALYKASDGHYEEADADAAAKMPCSRLALETGTGSKKVLIRGYIRNDAWNWTTLGGSLYASVTAGGLSESLPGSGKYAQYLGEVKTADIWWFDPNMLQIKAA